MSIRFIQGRRACRSPHDLVVPQSLAHPFPHAGLCNYTEHHITVSRHLAGRYADDEIHQVLLHEVAHAIAGSRAGHGPRWRSVATDLGYVGDRLHDGAIASELAPWVGTCPAGHVHYRYRRPTRPLACGKCSRRFDLAHLIDWQKRAV